MPDNPLKAPTRTGCCVFAALIVGIAVRQDTRLRAGFPYAVRLAEVGRSGRLLSAAVSLLCEPELTLQVGDLGT